MTEQQINLFQGQTAASIVEALRRYHDGARYGAPWAFFAELRIGTGYGREAEQRIDAWAIALWPSADFNRVAYEVKISRSDFLVEIKKPQKRRRAMMFSNQFYFATPIGLLKESEIPPECGLVEVQPDGRVSTRIPAPHRDTLPPTWMFMAAIIRRVKDGRAELG